MKNVEVTNKFYENKISKQIRSKTGRDSGNKAGVYSLQKGETIEVETTNVSDGRETENTHAEAIAVSADFTGNAAVFLL